MLVALTISKQFLYLRWLAGSGMVPCAWTQTPFLAGSGESYGESACLCLGAVIAFGKRRTSSFFGPEVTLEILSSSAVARCAHGYWYWG